MIINIISFLFSEESNAIEIGSSPIIGNRDEAPETKSPVSPPNVASADPWPAQCDEDIDRLVALHQNRSSLSSLGVSKKKYHFIRIFLTEFIRIDYFNKTNQNLSPRDRC